MVVGLDGCWAISGAAPHQLTPSQHSLPSRVEGEVPGSSPRPVGYWVPKQIAALVRRSQWGYHFSRTQLSMSKGLKPALESCSARSMLRASLPLLSQSVSHNASTVLSRILTIPGLPVAGAGHPTTWGPNQPHWCHWPYNASAWECVYTSLKSKHCPMHIYLWVLLLDLLLSKHT